MWSCIQPKKCSDIKVVAFGNVLVRHTMNTAAGIDDKILRQVTAEDTPVEEHEPKISGSAINTVCFLISLGTNSLFFGVCEEGDKSEIIYQLLKNINMDTYHFKLQTVPDTTTKRRISLIQKDSTSLYTNDDDSVGLTGSYLQKVEKEEHSSFLRPPNRKQIFYIEGFFVPKCEAVTTFIVRHYLIGRRCLALNLSDVYIVRMHFPHMLFLANNSLIIFGKRDEFEAFRECWGASCIKDFAMALAKESKVPKILVITNGSENVELITNYVYGQSSPGDLTFYTFHVSPVENATDTTGCGDIFVSAFLHEWLKKTSLSQCVRKAIWRATKSIKKNGRFSFHATLSEI